MKLTKQILRKYAKRLKISKYFFKKKRVSSFSKISKVLRPFYAPNRPPLRSFFFFKNSNQFNISEMRSAAFMFKKKRLSFNTTFFAKTRHEFLVSLMRELGPFCSHSAPVSFTNSATQAFLFRKFFIFNQSSVFGKSALLRFFGEFAAELLQISKNAPQALLSHKNAPLFAFLGANYLSYGNRTHAVFARFKFFFRKTSNPVRCLRSLFPLTAPAVKSLPLLCARIDDLSTGSFNSGTARAGFKKSPLTARARRGSFLVKSGDFARRAISNFWNLFYFSKKMYFSTVLRGCEVGKTPQLWVRSGRKSMFSAVKSGNRHALSLITAYSKIFFFYSNFNRQLLSRRIAGAFFLKDTDRVRENFFRLTPMATNLNQDDVFRYKTLDDTRAFGYKLIDLRGGFLEFNPALLTAYAQFLSTQNHFETNYFGVFSQNPKLIVFKGLGAFSWPSLTYFTVKRRLLAKKKSQYFDLDIAAEGGFSAFRRVRAPFGGVFSPAHMGPRLRVSFLSKFTKFELSSFFFFKPVFFKYLSLEDSATKNGAISGAYNFFQKLAANCFSNYFFYSQNAAPAVTNVIPSGGFTFALKQHVLKSFAYNKLSNDSLAWHCATLVKFIEHTSGYCAHVNVFTFLHGVLDPAEKARCAMWSQRLRSFKKLFGAKLFLTESLQIIYMTMKLKDPFFLANWLVNFFYKMSFWKYKLVFRYLQYILRYFFFSIFDEIHMRGLKFQLKGKVSVAGNGRTRTVFTKIGHTGHSTFRNKILYDLNLIRTFTGVLGFRTWLVF